MVNGHSNGSPGSGLGVNLGVDGIQEFRVLTNEYTAQYGKTSGGVINAVYKSGTNQFHGNIFNFLRNSALDARNFFDYPSIPAFRRTQFGASAGGPIKKDTNSSMATSNRSESNDISRAYPFFSGLDRGPADFDITHNFVYSFTWNIPTPQSFNGNAIAKGVLANWGLGGVFQFRTGALSASLCRQTERTPATRHREVPEADNGWTSLRRRDARSMRSIREM